MATWKLNGPDRDLWAVADVCKHFGWSRGRLYKLIRAGLFPRGRDMGGRQQWTGEDVAAYILLAGRWGPEGGGKVSEEPDEA